MMKRVSYLMLAFIILGGGFLAKANDLSEAENVVRAVRPDASVGGNLNFFATCSQCCDDKSAEDCRLVDIESLIEDLALDVSVLAAFDESCCASTASRISALSAFDQTCCATTNSNISVLSAFDQSALTATTSSINVLSLFDQSALTSTASRISILSALDQSCCVSTTSSLSVISSQLDLLADCGCCQFTITQADIDTGNYTIKNPGIYCLASDVVFTSGNAITISNTQEQVVLDLQKHTITASGGGINDAILLDGSTGGAIIYNGAIVGGINGIESTNKSSSVVIKDIEILATTQVGILIQNGSSDIVIHSVEITNAGSDGIYIVESQSLTNFSFFISDTRITKSGGSGVHMNGTFTAILEDVHAINNVKYGFSVESGIDISQGITFKNCYAEYNDLAGFVLIASSGRPLVTIVYQNCISLNNEGYGYLILATSGSIFAVNYYNCVAMCNVGMGFATGTGSSGALVHDVVYNNCISQLNRTYGFYIDCAGGMINHCTVDGNQSIGIFLDRVSSKWQVIDSSIIFNKNDGIQIQGQNSLIQRCNVANNSGNGIFIAATALNSQIVNCYCNNNSQYGVNTSLANQYIYGNNAIFNGAGNFNPAGIGSGITVNSTYWANVRDPLIP